MDEFETYEDVIDAYNANDMGYSTLTDYIKGQNIKIKEISMEPLADLQKSLFENKADGGMIGIEVLFRDKKANGGRVPMVSGGALKSIGSGIMKLFGKGDDAVDLAKQEEIFRTGPITTKFLEDVDNKVIDKFIRTRDTKGPGGYGMYDNFDDMPAGLKAAELISRIKKPGGGIDYERAEIFIGKKLKGDETIDELIKMVITEKKADGGRVGLFMGGPALEGQALNIYNSMNAYGFTDQEIADTLSARGLYTPAGSGTTTQPEQVTGIVNQQLTPQRDDRVIGLQETFTKDLSGDPRFNYLEPTAQANKYRFDRSVEPREGLLGFFDSAMNKMKESSFFQPKVRGTLGTRLANQKMLPIPLPSMITAQMRSPFNPDSPTYNPLLEGQLNFLEGLEGMIGRDPNTGGLKYGPESVLAGKNVISGFGSNNYEVALNKYLQRMNRYEKPTEFQKKQIARAQAELAAEKERQIREAKTKAEALKAIQSQGKMDYNPNIHGPTNYGRDSQGNQSFDFGGGFGIGSDGGPVSNRTGRGRQGYVMGGLTNLVDIYD